MARDLATARLADWQCGFLGLPGSLRLLFFAPTCFGAEGRACRPRPRRTAIRAGERGPQATLSARPAPARRSPAQAPAARRRAAWPTRRRSGGRARPARGFQRRPATARNCWDRARRTRPAAAVRCRHRSPRSRRALGQSPRRAMGTGHPSTRSRVAKRTARLDSRARRAGSNR